MKPSKELVRIAQAAVIKKLATVSVEPFGYFCEWRSKDCLYPNTQAMYYSGPGNGVDDDWNKHPDIHKNVKLYTAEAIAAARVQENERIVKLCKKRWKGGYPQEVIDDLVTAIRDLLGKEVQS